MQLKVKQSDNSPAVEKAIRKSIDFETSLSDVRLKSEKRAWIVAGVSSFITICLTGAIVYMLPLKEKQPYLVIADPFSGQSRVAKLSDQLQNTSVTANELVNKSNVTHFVVASESYDYELFSNHDWVTVNAMAAPTVATEFRNRYDPGQNPDSPFNKYGQTSAIRIKILSIQFSGGNPAENQTPTSATVRFQRVLYNKQAGTSQILDNKIANMTFEYKKLNFADEKYQIANPLGFQVSSYRVDADASVPVASPEMSPTIVTPANPGQVPTGQTPATVPSQVPPTNPMPPAPAATGGTTGGQQP